MKKSIYIILVVFCLFSIFGCDQFSSGNSKVKGKVLARVNDWSLTEKDFNGKIQAIIRANNGEPVVAVAALGLLNRRLIPPYIEAIDLSSVEGKQLFLNLMVNLELLAQEAQMRKLDKDLDFMKEIRRVKVELLNINLLNEVLGKVTVTPLEIEDFYENEYKKTLENINRRKVREIVLDTEAKATGILVELLQGADFSSLASKRSVAESAKDGGDLGYLVYQPNIKFQKFWEVVLLLDRGQVSSIFQDPTTKKFYIVKIDDIKKGEPESLSKIYDQLEFVLKQKKSDEAIDELISDVKSKVEVEINLKLLE